MKKDEKLLRALRLCVARNLARLRAERGLTFEALARRSGLHMRHIQRLEAGEANATLETIARLADGLEVDPRVLVTKPPRRRAVTIPS